MEKNSIAQESGSQENKSVSGICWLVPVINIVDAPGTVETGIGTEDEPSTHECSTCKKYAPCAGHDPCECNRPELVGKSFRGRCGNQFFVKFVPIRRSLK